MKANSDQAQPCASRCETPLKGDVVIPGDKSISHRAIMFGGLAQGQTQITGLLEGEDVMATANAMQAMGASVEKQADGSWLVTGVGDQGLQEPEYSLDMGNSGTSTRLLTGLIAGHEISAFMHGDASLSKRPMGRVIDPLTQMGARFISRKKGRLPLGIEGGTLKPFHYTLPIASAQVKSAILLAGLNTKGTTSVTESVPTRDHTENMLRAFGVDVQVTHNTDKTETASIHGPAKLRACKVNVPRDPSSAAFPVAAAILVPGSHVTLPNILMNPRRIGLYDTLIEMGADITFARQRIESGEPVADLVVRGGNPLKGVSVPKSRVASMIDEFPILSVVASCAEGETFMDGLEELRVKESDRLAMMARGLQACGVKLEERQASLKIYGTGQPPKGDALIQTALDHRIAMSFLVLSAVTEQPVVIDDIAPIRTSFPNFVPLMESLGLTFQTGFKERLQNHG